MNISRLLKNPLITGTLLMTASGIASRIIGFFYRIFLAQTIGAEALGIYQLIAPVFAMCFALTASSIQTSISKFVGDACGKNAGTSQGEITARGYLLLGLVISCTASVIVGIFLYTQSDWIALHFLGELRCAPLLSLLSFSMLPCCIHACINGYYYGKKRAGIPSFCQLVEQLARVGSVWLIYQYTLEKGMELTAFHAVAGLVAGECSGLITSLIAMSLEKRLPGHSYHTLSGQWKTMGKLFASMAVPLTINRVTTALFNSLENLLIPAKTAGIWLQCFGCPEYFWYPDRYDHVHHSVSQCTDQFLFRPFTSGCLGSPQCTQPRTDCANDKKSNPVRDCFLALFLRFCFWFSVSGWAKFCFTIRWPAILSASSPGFVPCCMSPVC